MALTSSVRRRADSESLALRPESMAVASRARMVSTRWMSRSLSDG